MQKSESIAALAAALAKAQGEIQGAHKGAVNTHFKSSYADLASIWDACRAALTKHGLAVMQFARSGDGVVEVETCLAHGSGEWVSETLAVPVSKNDAHGVGSALTYARRYGLASLVGVAPDDDDGNAAVKSVGELRQTGLKVLVTAADRGTAALELAWKTLSNELRAACKDELNGLKRDAAEVDRKKAAAREPAHAE